MSRWRVLACSLLLAAVPSLAAQDTSAPFVVRNGADDRILTWRAVPLVRVGGVDGPTAFFRVFPWTIDADARGRFYVLDVGDHRVAVFDSAGRHLWDLGGKGGGPGEFLQPVALAVAPDGTVLVLDAGRGALVRFDGAGRALGQVRLDGRAAGVGAVVEGILVGGGTDPLEHTRLTLYRDSTTVVLAAAADSNRMVHFAGCPMTVPGRTFFAPSVVWAADDETVVVNDTAAYRLAVWRGGRLAGVVTREVPAVRVSRRDALRAPGVRNGFFVRWRGGRCRITPEQLLDARGFADRVSPIQQIAVAPDGGIWVLRRRRLDGERATDLFTGGGSYAGTLPGDLPFPAAFLSPDRFVALVGGPDGIPVITVYELRKP